MDQISALRPSERVEDVEQEKSSLVLRPAHSNTAVIEDLDPGLYDLPFLFEDEELKLRPVSRYS